MKSIVDQFSVWKLGLKGMLDAIKENFLNLTPTTTTTITIMLFFIFHLCAQIAEDVKALPTEV
uniref:Uncharacterized protein n=1 Tax=Cucumis melo TaxID=3656 RepID=A0A9I9EA34_CUCME